MGESSKRGEIPAVTLFQSSSLYERVLPKAGPEHTVSTEKREKEKKIQSNKRAQHNRSTPQSLCKDRKQTSLGKKTNSGLVKRSEKKMTDKENRRIEMTKSYRLSQIFEKT